jgi:hypothetical protein
MTEKASKNKTNGRGHKMREQKDKENDRMTEKQQKEKENDRKKMKEKAREKIMRGRENR